MPTTQETKTSQPETPTRQRASRAVRFLRAATLAMILTTLGAWLGFC